MMVIDQASRPATKQHGDTDNSKDDRQGKGRKSSRNSGDILARRRFENIRKHSARTRHLTGILNNGEKNRLMIAEKQMAKTCKMTEARIHRFQEQLRRELHEMEAGRRALRRRSICVKDENRDKDRHDLSKYCQRGRYLYAMRNEVKSQKVDMESYNGRLEKAKKMLPPAKKDSTLAMDKGNLLGLAPATSYLKVGRRISVVEAPPAAKLLAFADSDSDGDDDIEEITKAIPVKICLDKKENRARTLSSIKTPPPFDVNQLRKEFGPEMRKALESLMMDDPSVMLAMPVSRETTRGSRRDFDNPDPWAFGHISDANKPTDGLDGYPEKLGDVGKLRLPPVQVEKSLVGRAPKNHKISNAAKPLLSTVTET